MERPQPSLLAQKSSSFSTSTREDRLGDSDRNLSLGAIRFEDKFDKKDIKNTDDNKPQAQDQEAASVLGEASNNSNKDVCTPSTIKEEEHEGGSEADADDDASAWDLATLSEEIDRFLDVVLSHADAESLPPDPPEIPDTVEKFVALVEKETIKFEVGESKWSGSADDKQPIALLDAVHRLSKLTAAFTIFSSDPKYYDAMNRTGCILHHGMSFLEDEFYTLLDDPFAKQQDPGCVSSKTKRPPSFSRYHEPSSDRCLLPSAENNASNETSDAGAFPSETVERLREIAQAMISAGYETECCQLFSVARRNTFEAGLTDLGYEKISIDDVQRMAWESLEVEIAKWIKAVRHAVTVSLAHEKALCEAVFASRSDIVRSLYCNLARAAVVQLLNFAEAVAMTKRSAEKLFKVLDMYETLRDVMPDLDNLFNNGPNENGTEEDPSSPPMDLKSEVLSTWSRLGEAAVAIFCDLESSIKADNSKNTVPGGAVHPLTRYVMNYLKYACEYMKTLEQVFQEHQKTEKLSSYNDEGEDAKNGESNHDTRQNNNSVSRSSDDQSPFSTQLVAIMDLLHANLEVKSKLYKDLALSSIFLMNNGRYVMQKIKGSAEINQLLGDTWCRKKSSELRQYHKNYQRETWSKVLACFKDEGLQHNGRVAKPVLKERFKSFNAMFEDIHKTQSSWVVSDEQLQSELRVSVSAVVVPAYRSFLGRFQQYLDAGRQTEKYIKFGPEDLETYIDDLFDGNPNSSMNKRKT